MTRGLITATNECSPSRPAAKLFCRALPPFVLFEFAVVLLKVGGVLVVIRLVEWRDVERKVSVVALQFVGTFLQSLVFFLPSFVLHRTTIRPDLRWLDMAR